MTEGSVIDCGENEEGDPGEQDGEGGAAKNERCIIADEAKASLEVVDRASLP
jgi:hypothetical protein